jgi:hypothetical protein
VIDAKRVSKRGLKEVLVPENFESNIKKFALYKISLED